MQKCIRLPVVRKVRPDSQRSSQNHVLPCPARVYAEAWNTPIERMVVLEPAFHGPGNAVHY